MRIVNVILVGVSLAALVACGPGSDGGDSGADGSAQGCKLSESLCSSHTSCNCGTTCLATNSSDKLCTVECTTDDDCAGLLSNLTGSPASCASHGYGHFCQ